VHGNAMGNAAFMRRGAAVVEVFMYGWWSPWFRDPMVDVFGLHYQQLQCRMRACLPMSDAQVAEEAAMKGSPEYEGRLKLRNVSVVPAEVEAAVVHALAVAAGAHVAVPTAAAAVRPPRKEPSPTGTAEASICA
jgi:hypothetical protein